MSKSEPEAPDDMNFIQYVDRTTAMRTIFPIILGHVRPNTSKLCLLCKMEN